MAKKAIIPAKESSGFDYKTIKSFEDACKKENLDPTALPDVSMIPEEFREAIIAIYKLFIIFKAINNGWAADFTNHSQWKYFPWLRVNSAGSGFALSPSYYGYGGTYTTVGSRLCTDSSEKAMYIGKQFGDIYVDLFLNK